MSADPLAELTDLVRRRFHGEERAGNRLRVNQTVLDALLAIGTARPEQPARPAPDGLFARLTGLPIDVDETLPAGVWQLVDDDGVVLREGVVKP